MGYRPVLVDLDIENNMIVPPGCIGASRPKVFIPNDDLTEDTVAFYFGFRAANMDGKLYKKQIAELADVINKKIKNKEDEMNKEYIDITQNKEDQSKLAQMKSVLNPFSTSKTPAELASG